MLTFSSTGRRSPSPLLCVKRGAAVSMNPDRAPSGVAYPDSTAVGSGVPTALVRAPGLMTVTPRSTPP